MSNKPENENKTEPNTDFLICCPTCNQIIMVEKINCGIFRHGQYVNSGKQLDPHASKPECELLIQQQMIYGCGKPFQVLFENGEIKIQKCDYI